MDPGSKVDMASRCLRALCRASALQLGRNSQQLVVSPDFWIGVLVETQIGLTQCLLFILVVIQGEARYAGIIQAAIAATGL